MSDEPLEQDPAASVDRSARMRATGPRPARAADRARSQSAHERDLAARSRTQTAFVRDEAATHRDQMATERDAGARARDDLAATIDAAVERLELERSAEHIEPLNGSEIVRRAAGDRERAATSRTRAAAEREAADHDRELAAADREQAACDRHIAAEELAAEGIDILTGAMRRRVGLAAIQRELDRTGRSGESLVVAFVDVDGLKTVNDTDGHPAGDELLREVVCAITEHLRSYDVIARFGGDEFVCSLAGQDAGGALTRFDEIRAHLSDAASGAAFTVGLAERGDEDTLDQLVSRADTAMIEARQHPDA